MVVSLELDDDDEEDDIISLLLLFGLGWVFWKEWVLVWGFKRRGITPKYGKAQLNI